MKRRVDNIGMFIQVVLGFSIIILMFISIFTDVLYTPIQILIIPNFPTGVAPPSSKYFSNSSKVTFLTSIFLPSACSTILERTSGLLSLNITFAPVSTYSLRSVYEVLAYLLYNRKLQFFS